MLIKKHSCLLQIYKAKTLNIFFYLVPFSLYFGLNYFQGPWKEEYIMTRTYLENSREILELNRAKYLVSTLKELQKATPAVRSMCGTDIQRDLRQQLIWGLPGLHIVHI